MAIAVYVPTVYVNGTAPAMNATNSNKPENQLKVVTDQVNLHILELADLPTTYEAIDATIARTGAVNVFTVAQKESIGSIPYAASVAFDMNLYNNFKIALDGNITLANPTNITDSEIQTGLIKLTQNATGGNTLTLGTAYSFINTDGTSTVADTVNIYRYTVVDSTNILLEYLTSI